MVRSAMLMGSAFPKLGEEARHLADTLKKLGEVIQNTRADQERRKTELAEYSKQRTRVTTEHAKKRQSEKAFQAELDSLREAIAKTAKTELAKSELTKSEDPSGLLAGIDKEVKAAAVLAPSGDRVAMLAPSRIKPPVPFAQTKGTLQLPSQGRRVVSFGVKTKHGRRSEGIQIQTRHGGTVISPCDGLVVYAAEFRTYGQVLIINAGDGYHILLAGLSQIDVQVGQSVLMGEPVGVMSSGVKSPGAEDGGPVLTVEFRKDQRPIDPDPWWSDATRKG
jgi:septal ring factor EnvC (AmiA/AmiB activator)